MARYVFFAFVLLLAACNAETKPVVVTYQLTHRADTTFLKQYKDSIRIVMDSLCSQNYSSIYDQTRDSLLREELKNIEVLMYDK